MNLHVLPSLVFISVSFLSRLESLMSICRMTFVRSRTSCACSCLDFSSATINSWKAGLLIHSLSDGWLYSKRQSVSEAMRGRASGLASAAITATNDSCKSASCCENRPMFAVKLTNRWKCCTLAPPFDLVHSSWPASVRALDREAIERTSQPLPHTNIPA